MTGENKKILLATDLSSDCRNAYTYAVNQAAACHGQITLLHVIAPQSISLSLETRINSLLGAGRYDEMMKEWEKEALSVLIGKRKEIEIIADALSKFRSALSKHADVCVNIPNYDSLPDDKVIVKKGAVVEEILTTAVENATDLIVLSSHSNSLGEAFISNAIQDVLRFSQVPVTIVPPVGI